MTFPRTLRTQNPFVETGAANSIFALADELGAGFVGSDSQLKLTPFQKQVFNSYKVAQQEEQEARMEDAKGGGSSSSRPRNPRASSSGDDHSMSETVRYKSNNDFSDEDSDRNIAEVIKK